MFGVAHERFPRGPSGEAKIRPKYSAISSHSRRFNVVFQTRSGGGASYPGQHECQLSQTGHQKLCADKSAWHCGIAFSVVFVATDTSWFGPCMRVSRGSGVTVMAMVGAEIERLIKQAFPDAMVTVVDLAGDGDHFAARVTSATFKGKSRIQQHTMVYDALQGNMGNALHALALETIVPT
jgi:stress-induced morphogen